MDWMIRILCGFHPMMAVEGEDGGGEGVIVDGADATGGGETVDQPVVDKPEAKEPSPPVEAAMLEGIKNVLKPADPEAAKKAEEQAAAAAAKKKADDEFTAANKGKTPEEIAAAQAAREAEAKKKAEAEEAAKLKAQKADDFHLSPQMKKHLSQEAQQRFHSLHRYAKEKETEVVKLTETVKPLTEARDTLLSILEETHTSQDDLVGYLNFNALLHSQDPKDLQTALGIVESQRAAIYKALGKEAPGVDLLAEFPDLLDRVEKELITREDALELANGRRRDQALSKQRNDHGEQQRNVEATKKVQDDALASIDKWSKEMAGKDIDYKKKEEKLLAELPEIIKNYPANLWLRTFQSLYKTIEVVKPAPSIPGNGGTLRPSGARPGGKTYTELTPDALRAGLGYPPAAG